VNKENHQELFEKLNKNEIIEAEENLMLKLERYVGDVNEEKTSNNSRSNKQKRERYKKDCCRRISKAV